MLTLTGGHLGGVSALDGSNVRIEGGAYRGINPNSTANVALVGNDFYINDVPLIGLEAAGPTSFLIPRGTWLTGTLKDGTPIAVSSSDLDFSPPAMFVLEGTQLPDIGPTHLRLSDGISVHGIRSGQTLVVDSVPNPDLPQTLPRNFNAGRGSRLIVEEGGSVGDNLETVGAELVIEGGSLGNDFDGVSSSIQIKSGVVGIQFRAENSDVSVAGGFIGHTFGATNGSTVNISGGEFETEVSISNESELRVSGGSIGSFTAVSRGSHAVVTGGAFGDFFEVCQASSALITGGSFRSNLNAYSNSSLVVAGGMIQEPINILGESEIHLIGTNFLLDGVDITPSLAHNEPFTILERGATLSGKFANGSNFSFDLNAMDDGTSTITVVPSDSTITVTLILPDDYNNSGTVDAADYVEWKNAFGSTVATPGEGADGNFDGVVDAQDYAIWREHLGESLADAQSSTSTPEPASLSLFFLVVLASTVLGKRLW